MSIRYSGDAEVRLGFDDAQRVYRGTVSDPNRTFRGWVPLSRAFRRDPTCSEAYDDAARRLAENAQRWARGRGRAFMVEQGKGGRVSLRRVYQSPCPLEDL